MMLQSVSCCNASNAWYVQVHKLMLQDTARIQAYKNAIFSCVEYFKDKVVMDVGAGTGRFRLLPAL
jgi:protein arginine N-methyltransferase 1